jgi:hypothetical protein
MRAPLRAALCAALATLALLAAAPSPEPTLPTVPLHATYVVAVNKLGQVARVISATFSKDKAYNTETYGNALQAFIRTPDGQAISGRYRLTYDYNPTTRRIAREVALVGAGGVDPKAPGAVTTMLHDLPKKPPAAAVNSTATTPP